MFIFKGKVDLKGSCDILRLFFWLFGWGLWIILSLPGLWFYIRSAGIVEGFLSPSGIGMEFLSTQVSGDLM